jgi:hypothetical protein
MEVIYFPKRRLTFNGLHGVISQKIEEKDAARWGRILTLLTQTSEDVEQYL